MKVFLDTNVLASAMLSRGLCHELLEKLILDHEVVLDPPVRQELNRIVRERFRAPDTLRDWMNRKLDELPQVRATLHPVPTGIPDPDAGAIIACAWGASAELFVTGDKALLALGNIDGMPIVSPRECWERLFLPK